MLAHKHTHIHTSVDSNDFFKKEGGEINLRPTNRDFFFPSVFYEGKTLLAYFLFFWFVAFQLAFISTVIASIWHSGWSRSYLKICWRQAACGSWYNRKLLKGWLPCPSSQTQKETSPIERRSGLYRPAPPSPPFSPPESSPPSKPVWYGALCLPNDHFSWDKEIAFRKLMSKQGMMRERERGVTPNR